VGEPLSGDDRRAARRALALSFDADPMFQHLFPEERRRARWLEIIMAAAMHQYTEMLVSPDGPGAGVLLMASPGTYPVPERLASFFLAFWRRPWVWWPPRTAWRTGRAVLEKMAEVHPTDAHLYVAVLGVHPERKGQGLGGALMRRAVERADEAGVPLYLETTNPVNLGFYGRFGLKVVGEHEGPYDSPTIWTLQRPASPS